MQLPLLKHIERGMVLEGMTPTGQVRGRVTDKGSKNTPPTVDLITDAGIVTVNYDDLDARVEEPMLRQIHPMLAKASKEKDLEDLLASDEWDAEPKFDGERAILTYLPNPLPLADVFEKEFQAVVRSESEATWFRANTRVVGKNSGLVGVNTFKLPHLAVLRTGDKGATVLDAELLHNGGKPNATIEEKFRALRSIMGSSDEKAIKKQEELGPVYAVIFDALFLDGEDLRSLPFARRRRLLEEWFEGRLVDRDNHAYERGFHFELAPVARGIAAKKAMLDWLLENGWEGMMLKNISAHYTDTTITDRRSYDILKVKPFKEDDVIITGFLYGEGEHNQHRISRVTFAQWVKQEDVTDDMLDNTLDPTPFGGANGMLLVDMGQTSGIAYSQEEMFRADEQSFIGKIMEVRFKDRWPETGKMRHPSFVRIRDDKTPLDCVYGRDA